MRVIFFLLLAILTSCQTSFAQAVSIDELRRMFDYDRKLPLDVKEVGVIVDKNGVRVHDINYVSPKGGRVTAYLVVPPGKGPFAGVVFGHWSLGTRTEFLPEAMMYAELGVVSLLVDDPDVRPAPWRHNAPGTEPLAVRANYIQAVVDMRRGLDLLLSLSSIDPERIAYVGHSSAARWGAILSAVDKRIKGAVLMAGVPSDRTILLESDDPDYIDFRKSTPKRVLDTYFKTVGPLDAINYVPYAAPVSLLFQFARFEQFFKEAPMLSYAQAASEPKLVRWYDSGHALNDIQALLDRANWLSDRIGMKPVSPLLLKKFGASN